MTIMGGSQRWGRYTRFTDGRVLGKRPATWSPFLVTRITVGADKLEVRSIGSQKTWSLARGDVRLAAPVPDGHHLSGYSVGFLLMSGGAWALMLGPPAKVMNDLERFGWPIDRDARLSWTDVAENARPSAI